MRGFPMSVLPSVMGVILSLCCVTTARGEEPLRVGVAELEVTPPVGFRMQGGYGEVLATGVKDPLLAKGLVFEQGDCSCAIVINDLCGVTRELTGVARRRIAETVGIPAGRVVIAATHTHGGPLYDDLLRDLLRERVLTADGRDPREALDYQAWLVDRWVEVVAEAWKARRPSRVEGGTAKQEGLAFNRRFHMRSGPVRCNPGKGNPDVVRPAGPVDTSLPMLLFRQVSDERPFAGLGAFAMHVAVHGGTLFSADYPGHLQTALRAKHGPGFVHLFAEGCAGDINHVNVRTLEPDPVPEVIGARLAATMLEQTPKLVESKGELAHASATVSTALREANEAQRTEARRLFSPEGDQDGDFLERVEAYRFLLIEMQRKLYGERFPVEVQVIRLGRDVAIVALPHEVFVEIGMAIRERSPFKTTLVMSLAGGMDFYVPTRKAYAEGSYEVTNSPVVAGTGELLVETAVRLLGRLGEGE